MDSRERFSDRVGNYVRCRPAYPHDAIACLFDEVGFGPGSRVADVGSGTGIFTRQIAPLVGRVYAVEPNGRMRAAAVQAQENIRNIVNVAAQAESTTLPDASVDFVTAAQSFHWFDRAQCREEFARILVPHGKVVLIWNLRRFGEGYENIMRTYSAEYDKVREHVSSGDNYSDFFSGDCIRRNFENSQKVDREGFFGRVLSSSYTPLEKDPAHKPFMDAIGRYFDENSSEGKLVLRYETELIYGEI